MGFKAKPMLIDASGHLLGRLASLVAKALLQGEKVVIVRCELIEISGKFHRNKLKFLSFLHKHVNTNPARGPIHFRSPSKIVWRAIRGMLPHKTPHGAEALGRLKTFEGIPAPYDKQKRLCVPSAVRAVRLNPRRKFTVLGRLSSEVGWKYRDVVDALEQKRKVKAAKYWTRALEKKKLEKQAREKVKKQLEPLEKIIHSYGYR